MVLRRVEALGVQVLTRVSVDRVCTSRSPDGDHFTGIDLTDGTHLDARLVVFAIGITPRDDIARNAGIRCSNKHGVVVNDDLCTSAPDVYAIGECANWNVNKFHCHSAALTMTYRTTLTASLHLEVSPSFNDCRYPGKRITNSCVYPDLS